MELDSEQDWSRTAAGWELAYKAGFRDAGGAWAGGSEIMHLVGHGGALYAAVGYWKDARNPFSGGEDENSGWAQVLRLDSPTGQWQVDLELGPNHVRPEMLSSLTFTTDADGGALAEPVSLLITGTLDPDSEALQPDFDTNVFLRDADGHWERVTVFRGEGGLKAGSARAGRVYRDRVTGVDRVFISLGSAGILSGVYDPAERGGVRWDETSESGSLDCRPLAIVEADGGLLFAAGNRIYRRSDGAQPSWSVVHEMDGEVQSDEGLAGTIFTALGGIRGLTRIDGSAGSGDSLLFVWTAAVEDPGFVYRLDPDGKGGYTLHEEACIADAACYHLAMDDTDFVIGGYNEMTPALDPATGQTVHLFGFETAYDGVHQRFPTRRAFRSKGLYAGAMYGVRSADGSYRWGEVNGLALEHELPLIAPRAFAVSPFEQDGAGVIYFGGFDTNFRATSDSAWIYRAPASVALGTELWALPED